MRNELTDYSVATFHFKNDFVKHDKVSIEFMWKDNILIMDKKFLFPLIRVLLLFELIFNGVFIYYFQESFAEVLVNFSQSDAFGTYKHR